MRFRCLQPHDCKEEGCPKYLGEANAPTRIFNTRALHEAGESIAIAEGELDAVMLNQCGIPAVGVTGAKNWKSHYWRVFAGFNIVHVFEDGDAAGKEFTRKVCSELNAARIVTLGAGQDVSDFVLLHGEEALRERMRA